MLTQVSVSVKVSIWTVAAVQIVSETKLRSSYNFFYGCSMVALNWKEEAKGYPEEGAGWWAVRTE